MKYLNGERLMSDGALEETRKCWNELADGWRVQVGAEGDSNRRMNSDPALWEFAGDVDTSRPSPPSFDVTSSGKMV
jgi:hypothetical protein